MIIVLKNKSFNWLFGLLIVNCAVLFQTAQFVHAVSIDKPSTVSNIESNSDSEAPADKSKPTAANGDLGINSTESATGTDESDNILSEVLNKNQQKVKLVIHINVPHNNRAVDWCRIYPYPIAPPLKKGGIEDLPYKDKALRSQLLAMSYWSRTRPDKIYPAGGWRMQYALRAALAKSGIGLPHTIMTEYPWVENITPYMRKETMAINAKEKERKNRYYQMQQVFNDYRAELETEALNKGLFPIDVPMRVIAGYRKGQAIVDKANWWIVAIHKVAGLKYYWLWPVKLSDSPQQGVTLNEDNAIFIEGAW